MIKGLLIDCYDSYTLNLWEAMRKVGLETEVVFYDDLNENILKNYSFLVLSPGPFRPMNYPKIANLLDFCIGKMPIFGVCLGHQILGEYFGGEVVRAQKPVHGVPIEIKIKQNRWLLKEKMTVMPYHSLVIDTKKMETLDTIAQNKEGESMAFLHPSLPILSVQFHPESLGTENSMEFFNETKRLIIENI